MALYDWAELIAGTYRDVKVAETQGQMDQADAQADQEALAGNRPEQTLDANAAAQQDLSGPGALMAVRGTLAGIPTWAWLAVGGLAVVWAGIRIAR